MRRAGVALLVLVLVVLAGCSGVGTGPTGPTATATPAPVPTATANPVPFGVDAGGVARPLALANAHAAGISGSYAFASNWTVRRADGSLHERVAMQGRVTPEQWRTSISVAGSSPTILSNRPTRGVFWSDRDGLVGKRVVDGESRYQHVPPATYTGGGFYSRLQRPYPYQPLDLLVASVDLRVVEERSTGVVLAGNDVTHPASFDNAVRGSDPSNVSYRLFVDASGVVRRQRLAYEATFRGERVTVVRHVRYLAVGNVSVERPSWYDTAVENSGL